jgi:hypothetical protein
VTKRLGGWNRYERGGENEEKGTDGTGGTEGTGENEEEGTNGTDGTKVTKRIRRLEQTGVAME